MKKKERAKRYSQLVASLPGTWEDFVSPIDCFRDQDLLWLTQPGGRCFDAETAEEYAHARMQECHAMAAHAWLSNPGWQLVLGFAAMESCCSTEWLFHSFCVTESGQVVEPTPLGRGHYWGVVLSEDQAVIAVREELDNLVRLGFELTPALLGRLGN